MSATPRFADLARLPYDLRELIASRIGNEASDMKRVVLAVTSKLSATIAWA